MLGMKHQVESDMLPHQKSQYPAIPPQLYMDFVSTDEEGLPGLLFRQSSREMNDQVQLCM